jgi:SAM-dependent methyltransferase
VRVLVAIANHGTKNLPYLRRLLASYRAMEYDVDIVVLSDVDKDFGADVEVRVGAPTDDPRSLPFAHRQLFADRLEDYDLFIYSEDDTLVEQSHIDAFLEFDTLLPETEVPGFLRFEVYPDGRRSISSIHSFYRWDPASVEVRGGEVVAAYTNDHAACYMLTRAQLRRAIASGGFLVEPHHGAYDMLVSAATDPYTRCGMRRRLVVSRIDDVLLAHLPNVYLGRMGVDEDELRTQVAALIDIAHGRRGRDQSLDPGTSLASPEWGVPQHSVADEQLAALVPDAPRRTLSVGCTSGRLELSLGLDPTRVVGLPIDEVVGAVAARRGIRVLRPDLAALDEFRDGAFDLVLLHQVLHHVPDPVALLQRVRRLLSEDGQVVVSVPNLRHERLRVRAGRSLLDLPRRDFIEDGVHATTPARVRGWARAAGFELAEAGVELTPGVRRRVGWLRGVAPGWVGHTLHTAMRPTSARRPHHRRAPHPGTRGGDREVSSAAPVSRVRQDGIARVRFVAAIAAAVLAAGAMAAWLVAAPGPTSDPSASSHTSPAADPPITMSEPGGRSPPQPAEDHGPDASSAGGDAAREPGEPATSGQAPGVEVSAATTGPAVARDELRPSGSVTTERDGQVLAHLDVEGEIKIAHHDVVIEHVRIRTGDSPYGISYVEGSGAAGAVVRHVEIDGGGNAEQVGVLLGEATISDSHIHGVRVGMQARSGAVIERNRIHDLAADEDTHGTAISVHGGRGIVIRDNNLEGSTSAALSLYPRVEPIEDVLVEGNVFNGGSYCVYAGDVDMDYRADNRGIQFVGNVFGRSLHRDCGIHGPFAAFNPAQPGNRWKDNVWLASGEPIE